MLKIESRSDANYDTRSEKRLQRNLKNVLTKRNAAQFFETN